MSVKTIDVYTDGSYLTDGSGGWSLVVILPNGRHVEQSGYSEKSAPHKMEMTAAIQALALIKGLYPNEDSPPIALYTDAQILQRGMTELLAGWKAKNWTRSNSNKTIASVELWKALDKLCIGMSVDWRWVKAHKGNPMNERADLLARIAAQTQTGIYRVIDPQNNPSTPLAQVRRLPVKNAPAHATANKQAIEIDVTLPDGQLAQTIRRSLLGAGGLAVAFKSTTYADFSAQGTHTRLDLSA